MTIVHYSESLNIPPCWFEDQRCWNKETHPSAIVWQDCKHQHRSRMLELNTGIFWSSQVIIYVFCFMILSKLNLSHWQEDKFIVLLVLEIIERLWTFSSGMSLEWALCLLIMNALQMVLRSFLTPTEWGLPLSIYSFWFVVNCFKMHGDWATLVNLIFGSKLGYDLLISFLCIASILNITEREREFQARLNFQIITSQFYRAKQIPFKYFYNILQVKFYDIYLSYWWMEEYEYSTNSHHQLI